MGSRVRYTFEDVRNYINGREGNGCKLLSTEYKNNSTKLKIRCACGEIFEKSFNAFKSQNQKQCPKCGGKIGAEKNRNDIEEVRNYINGEEGNGCKLLSTEYKNNNTKLLIQCSCGNTFETTFRDFKSKNQKQCPKCGNEKRTEKNKNQVVFNCDYCGKECSIKKSHYEKREHHFCSKECSNKFQENQVVFNCEYCGKESKMIKCRFENFKHHFCSMECRAKWQVGENNTNYNPNITNEEREKGRHIEGYDDFIMNVYERDNYTCQYCRKHGGKLNTHHLNGYDNYKDFRIEVNNGIVLCEDCHKEFHKIYGYGDNTWQQFREFLYNKYLQTKDLYFLSLIETIDLRCIQLNNKAS